MDVLARMIDFAMMPTDLSGSMTIKKALLFLMASMPGVAAVALGFITLIFHSPV